MSEGATGRRPPSSTRRRGRSRLHRDERNRQSLATRCSRTTRHLRRRANKTLSQRASELSGPEVAAIAQGIAGPNVGQQARPEVAGDRGSDAANRTEVGDRPGAGPERTPAGERTDVADATPANETATKARKPSRRVAGPTLSMRPIARPKTNTPFNARHTPVCCRCWSLWATR